MLSEIKGNCYALNIATPHITTHEILKVIHKRVGDNDFESLNVEQKKYAHTLKSIFVNEKVHLDAYTSNKEEYHVKLTTIEVPIKPKYYFEISTIYGKITSIGGKTLGGKTHIKINEGNFDIEITPNQEKELINHYKKTKLSLTIKKKVDFETENIVSAILEDYEESSENDFFQGMKALAQQYPDGLFSTKTGEDLLLSIRNNHFEEKQMQD